MRNIFGTSEETPEIENDELGEENQEEYELAKDTANGVAGFENGIAIEIVRLRKLIGK